MAQQEHRIGRYALLLALSEENDPIVMDQNQVKSCVGKVGTMDSQKIVAAIETAAKSNGLINGNVYREVHALYHAILEAIQGVTRGHL